MAKMFSVPNASPALEPSECPLIWAEHSVAVKLFGEEFGGSGFGSVKG